MEWKELEVNVPLEECKDSLLFNQGDIIVSLSSTNGIEVYIGVVGDVRLFYNDEVYRYPDNYPEEITNALKDGTFCQLEADGVVEVINNNWFEVFVKKNGNFINSDVWESTLDDIGEAKLKAMLVDYIESSYPELCEPKTKKNVDREERA